jgi:hypothetical protein
MLISSSVGPEEKQLYEDRRWILVTNTGVRSSFGEQYCKCVKEEDADEEFKKVTEPFWAGAKAAWKVEL